MPGTDINYLLYNLSDPMFRECITYLSAVSVYYFTALRTRITRFSIHVLDRLVLQLNPFDRVYRPIVSRLSALRHTHRKRLDAVDELFPAFCKAYIEAFLCTMIRSVEMSSSAAGSKSKLVDGLSNINIRYESLNVPLSTNGWTTLSAGYAHGCRIIQGCGYVWGSNQIPYAVDNNFVSMSPGLGELRSLRS